MSTPTADAESATTTGPPHGGTIVVGYSDKPEGQAALDRALDEARLRGHALIVVHTLDAEGADRLLVKLRDSGVAFDAHAAADPFNPADDVLAFAEQSEAEFIVMGLRRRSPVGKLLLGSNAQRVLLDAACPVLAVKAPRA